MVPPEGQLTVLRHADRERLQLLVWVFGFALQHLLA